MQTGFPFPVKDGNGLCAERESRQWQETIHSQRHCFPLRMTDRRRHSSISTVSGRKTDQGRISLLTGRHLHIRRSSLLYMPVVTGMSLTACRRAGARHHPCRWRTPVVLRVSTSATMSGRGYATSDINIPAEMTSLFIRTSPFRYPPLQAYDRQPPPLLHSCSFPAGRHQYHSSSA